MTQTVHEFTARVPRWVPYLETVQLDSATSAQLEAMKVTPSNRGVSEYVLTLAHDPETLAVRSPLFNAIMYGRGGLSRAERELGAVGASVVNRCVYCAAVHADRYIQLTKRPEVIDAVFAGETQASLDDDGQPVFDFAVALSQTPPAATPDMVRALRARGKSETEILDLILSIGIFGWANRLMHTLGEPVAE